VDDIDALRQALGQGRFDVVICDYSLPSLSAHDALNCVRAATAGTPFIIVSGRIGEDIAVAMVKQGADDFLNKDRLARLPMAVEAALEQRRLIAAKEDAERRDQDSRAQLAQAEKMNAIGRLAGGVAHDFNNLMAVILNYANLLIEDGAADDAHKEDVLEIRAAAESATTLTRQLLTFSRKDALQLQETNLYDVVLDTYKLLQRMIGEDIQVFVSASPQVWPVYVDPGHAQQVLMNLAINARDAMPGGGELRIEVANQLIGPVTSPPPAGEDTVPYVEITITDTGSGIDPDVVEHIFEPFFTTKDPGRGTGLGLATVYGIVQGWGGSIETVSDGCSGTTFRILVPAMSPTIDLTSSEERPVPPLAPLHPHASVLVVEDQASVRTMLERILSRGGYAVRVAASGEEAIAICQDNHAIDVVVTDVVMPRMSGTTLLERLADIGPDKAILISGYSDETIPGQTGPMTVRFLQKPFEAAALLAVLDDLLTNKPGNPDDLSCGPSEAGLAGVLKEGA